MRPLFLPALCLFLFQAASAQDVALIPFGSVWKYLDNGSDQSTAWRASGFNDAAWVSGPGQLGYGDGDEATVVSYGPSSSAKYITSYFRKTITIPSVGSYSGYRLRLIRDDGIVVYVNGNEVLRQNFGEGTIGYTTLSYQAVATSEEGQILEHVLAPSAFVNGSNTIAVEIHQSAATSSDVSFDLELIGLDNNPSVFRGPYLMAASANGITVCWNTDVPSTARVRYGTSPGALNSNVTNNTSVRQHELAVTGLLPNTTYYYTIGTSTQDLAGGDATHFFKTSPMQGSEQPLRLWVVGDAGSAFAGQTSVRNSYLNFITTNTKADGWLFLGDNVYSHGRECEYLLAMFRNMYEGILRNTTIWPTPGNHDYGVSGMNGLTNAGPYYDIFAPPTQGGSGGVPSNTEAYYAYDIGNVHFISLDSYGVSRATTGAMATWLQADLNYAKANAKWIIAYWHHPPYTKGSHDSDDIADSNGLMRDMRENIVPILEQNGVDLVLNGHSHSYERSFLIDGHYGVSSTFNAGTMKLDGGSGRIGAPNAYMKPADATIHSGTVYTVCGVSGKLDDAAPLNHPAMFMSTISHYGSMILDIRNDSLKARFLNTAGAIVDYFDMVKPRSRLKLGLKAFLEGPYDVPTGLMRDGLRSSGLIPATEPYTGLFPQMGDGGGETVTPAVLATTGPTAIVDWVFVELRSAVNPAQVVATRSALIRRDGQVVKSDGVSPIEFTVPVGDYHVSIRHRNHLGTMTATPIRLNRTLTSVDFTQASTPTWGTEAQRTIGAVRALWTGDVLRDGTIRYLGQNNDRDPILVRVGGSIPTQTATGYDATDTSLDGFTRYLGLDNDRDPILLNIGGSIPTATRQEQLP